MPSRLPLLSSDDSSPPEVSKKPSRKLLRKNPPSSTTSSRQKLPSTDSSTISLAKPRPASSWSTSSAAGGWFSRSSFSGGRKSMDSSTARNEQPLKELQRPLPCDVELGSNSSNGGALTPSGGGNCTTTNHEVSRCSKETETESLTQSTTPTTQRKKNIRPQSAGNTGHDSWYSLPPPPIPARPDSMGSNQQDGVGAKLSEIRQRSKTFPIDSEPLLPPTAPFAGSDGRPRTSSGSPCLPPLPTFQAGSLGIGSSPPSISSQDSTWTERPPLSPKHPGRKARSRSASRSPQSESVPSTPKVLPSPLKPSSPPESLVELGVDFPFHAVTAEEPIVLPSRSTSSGSAPDSQSPPIPADPKKKERRGSFLGGWKLALKNSRSENNRDGGNTPTDSTPIGVGSGGGWIYRRRGSFSSPRPPSTGAAQHKTYAQEYKEFRNSKGSSSSSSSKSSAVDPPSPATANSFAARAAAAGVKPSEPQLQPSQSPAKSPVKISGSPRRGFKEKVKNVEAKFSQKQAPSAPVIFGKEVHEKDLAGLDIAVRQMNLLEEQLRSGRPLSPPDSRDGEADKEKLNFNHDTPIAPLVVVKTNSLASDDKGFKQSPTSSPTSPAPGRTTAQSTPVGHKKAQSLSLLRNEIQPSTQEKADKGKAKEHDGSATSSRHSASSMYPPPSEYLGKNKASSSATSRPPTPPKPIAKLFVICCRCKYWHDLPSVMYRGMVENGGATRCPYCLHGMEASCCSGYTCVVYMHQKHH